MDNTAAGNTQTLAQWFAETPDLEHLAPARREFLHALGELLDRFRPPEVDRSASTITPHRQALHVTIAHSQNGEHSLLLEVSDNEVVVSFGSEHEHFSREDPRDGRVWPFDRGNFIDTSVFFVELLLTGRIRVEVLRRPFQLKTRAYWMNDAGEPELFLRGGTLLPIVGWSRTPDVEQITFMTT